jgi:citronellyl-CoA dehydrogenase
MAIGVQTDMCTPALARFGSDELKREFLAPAIAGDMVGCVGVSEPGAGSDVSGIKSVARKDGDDYLISGQKMWITNSLQADWMCMLVNTGEGRCTRTRAWSWCRWTARASRRPARSARSACTRATPGLIYFDDVRVPQRYRIGAEGQGFIYQMQQFQEERCGPRRTRSRRCPTASRGPSSGRRSASSSARTWRTSSTCSSSSPS